ncbi:threonine--tRNA ligase [Candidatus Gottesmanbacteria bacterium RIFCSPLOWO2_01_FULL_48_11]|uniref:Threonine--tRNA ligase n=1 Tax=Candidatus Gottesmanbacteria bacterium RIFCSPLOWO2_01_FULL_48_11 TaxID=1798395 RepID=A0A1F6AU31_9BACT|nr:MAG: threonine--tRNA ligase [Candidatus Gottesmanbacteria bacterium RIFCSPLOWO2_01_FULL_48_11]
MKQKRDHVYKSGHEDYNHLDTMRHSCAHLLAYAVMKLWPKTTLGIGPTTENGFYYDFDLPVKLSDADLTSIEVKMAELQKLGFGFERSVLAVDEAIKRLIKQDQTYKVELLKDLQMEGETEVSFYQSGDFIDLCKGPHVKNISEVGAFKLLSVAGAYWKGSEKNKMLTRIYGTCFSSQAEVDNFLKMQEEAKLHDHRKLGKELGLFVFSDLVGAGLPLLLPKGATIRRVLERFIVDEEIKRGYLHVITPPLAKVDLYRTSGHYPYYKDTMYPPMVVDEEELILRPMTCPHHFMLYKSSPHSYRELPMRLAELSPQFRYEKSGELTGLMRVRMFTLADAHIITPPEQAKEEIRGVLDLVDYVNTCFGMKRGVDYRYRLSLGDRNDTKKYYKDDAAWDHAEQVLREVLVETKAPYFEAPNEAAFYGPKIDVQVKNVAGREETAFTVQYDFVMPKRFELTYIDESGKEKRPIVVHRSSLGAFERTMAFLIEKFGGAFPAWLAPVQAIVLPIADRHLPYAQTVVDALKQANIRAELDDRSERLSAKIRDAQNQKVCYMLIVGDKEESEHKVSERGRSGKDYGMVALDAFIKNIREEIDTRSLS